MTARRRFRITVQPNCPHWGNVLLGLDENDLRPLAAHLRENTGQLDPCVAKRLIRLIEGDDNASDLVLRIVSRSTPTATRTPRQMHQKWATRLRVIHFVGKRRCGKRNAKQVFHEAAVEFSLTEGTVRRLWDSRGSRTFRKSGGGT